MITDVAILWHDPLAASPIEDPTMTRSPLAVALALAATLVCTLQAQDRSTITFADGRIFPESLTSSKDGAIYFGSLGTDSVYRAASKSSVAQVWIKPKTAGLMTVLGVLADDRAGVLWVCASATGGRNGAPVVGETALKAFVLKDASLKASYPFPNGGLCNDIAVAKNGTVYATDTVQGRVLRLKKGASALDVWASDPMQLATADGIALLADGAVYVNSVGQGTLMRIAVKADGSADTIAKLEPSRPLMGPDGMRSVGNKTLLLVEGGRLDEVTIDGTKATVKVLKEGMNGPTAVTLVGDRAYVAEARLNYRNDPKLRDQDPGPFQAVSVAYKRP
jgi:sugar lactone lactonase YvrE